MPKYMVTASYSADGAKGLLKEGGTGRRTAVQKLVEGLGGKLEAFYYALGEHDVYIIVDLPDVSTSLALSVAVNSTGAVRLSSLQLVTPEEMDIACKKTVSYRAPGA
jgi:uncharacterized protein with GYD domain